ncbi:monocarboxylate transporter 10-like isoform X2 [Tigriopus californicus]|uniref:monocarboxylate transporter 10-like isoform X2 n=1 Tax=Tigriopus californicus TaxID=6832 RepID=UPI0027DA38D8|nr:monocarboxylate transporter 10-like isoform X2 [Tigriopus californicus]
MDLKPSASQTQPLIEDQDQSLIQYSEEEGSSIVSSSGSSNLVPIMMRDNSEETSVSRRVSISPEAVIANSTKEHYVTKGFTPPDGGFWAWLVLIASFLTNGIIFGTINSFGVIFVYLCEQYHDDKAAATKASLVGSVAVGATFFLSPVSGILADQFGIRKTAFFGGFVAFLGMLLSSFFVNHIDILYLTYGVMFGGGSSLCYTPSLVILGHYFKRRMGVVNGLVTAGSSLFTVMMPYILEGLLSSWGLVNCFRFLAFLTFFLMLAALTFAPLMPPLPVDDSQTCVAKIVNVHNWKNPKYVIWALAVPCALFGYFVPYVHIVKYVKDILPEKNGSSLVMCIGVTSGLGRIVFGRIADLPGVNRIFLQQISFVCIGICTMLLTAAPYFAPYTFEAMIAFALVMGVFDGCFITMFGPIAFDICGPVGASQAIGFILGMCSFPLTIGPPVAGMLYDYLGNYTVAFLAAGCPPIIGSLVMCAIHYARGTRTPSDQHSSDEEDNLNGDVSQNLLSHSQENGSNSKNDPGSGARTGLTNTVTATTFLAPEETNGVIKA